MPNIGPVELIIILVIALLVIGPGKLPDVGSALGKSIREFRKAATDVQESVKLDAPNVPAPVPAPIAPAAPTPAPIAPAVATTAPVVAAQAAAAPAPNTLAAAATPNELSAPAAPDPAATAADAATEARV
jgi:TatA/E family protein of Tat protein translocase